MVIINEMPCSYVVRLMLMIVALLASIAPFNGVQCDFVYGYDAEDFTLAIINISFIDPSTGSVAVDREELGKYGSQRGGTVSGVVGHVRGIGPNYNHRDACDQLDERLFPSGPRIPL